VRWKASGWLSVSYCDTNAKTELDSKDAEHTMVEADFAAQIGRCSRPNTISTATASARMLSVDKTAYGADRGYYSPVVGDCGGPLPSASYQ
jgi:hypothetical protein